MDRSASIHPASDSELLALLCSTPPFDALPPDAIGKLCLRMTRLALASGQALFEKGDVGEAMYLVLSGRLHVAAESGAAAPNEIGP